MKHSITTFTTKAKALHEDKYDYSKIIFKTISDKYPIICPIHGEFTQTAYVHLRGGGCPKCGSIETTKKITHSQETIINKFKAMHKDTYDYSKVSYKDMHTKVEILCKVHGSFFQTPTHHSRGRGCPDCNKYFNTYRKSYYKDKHTILYVLYLNEFDKYKIGITSREIFDRYKQENIKYTIMLEQHFIQGEDAWSLEKLVIKLLKPFKYKGNKLFKHTSNSEVFTINPLNTIKDLLWKQIKKI